ncbi:hypothetical protein Aperf_G00000057205 [Anoplocephala perfoliata]
MVVLSGLVIKMGDFSYSRDSAVSHKNRFDEETGIQARIHSKKCTHELSTLAITRDIVEPGSILRLSAFLIPQDVWKSGVNMSKIPADRIVHRSLLTDIFQFEPVAGVSYVLNPVEASGGLDPSTATSTSIKRALNEWIPNGEHTDLEILNLNSGGEIIHNHFHDWIIQQRNGFNQSGN